MFLSERFLALSLGALAALAVVASAAPRASAAPGDVNPASTATPAGDPAPGVVGAKKFATAVDCNGAVAFSSKGAAPPAAAAATVSPLHFADDLTDKSVGWSRHTGEFTTFCPGLYQFAFSSGDAPGHAKLSLRKRASGGTEWRVVVSSGAGGANVVLLDMDVGDAAAVFLEEGALAADAASAATFSGFRVAKKTP